MSQGPYKRVLLKLSGEALMGDRQFGLDMPTLDAIADQISEGVSLGVEIAIVIGGGNIFRGLKGSAAGMDRATADYMGMLATMINGMALQDALEKHDVVTRLMSAIEMKAIAETYIRRRAERHMSRGRVVIFGAGTGSPYFTTDTTAALRASEIEADIVMKATKVDGIFDKDPEIHDDAERIPAISYREVLQRDLRVMDQTAITLCRENKLPILVFDMTDPGNVVRALKGETLGTLVSEG